MAPATILTLAAGEIIVALGIDPGTAKMLISTISSLNISNTNTAINKLYWYDGFSNKALRAGVQVEDMITGFQNVGGVTFCGYGQNLGYIAGSGGRFLRKLTNVTLNNEELPYKHNMASIGSTLYVADGNKILAYGPVRAGGGNIFYYCYRNKTNDNVLQSIFYAGNNKLGVSFASGNFFTIDVTSISDLNNLDFRTNWIRFSRPVNIQSIWCEFNASIASTGNFTFSYFDDRDTISNSISVEGGTLTSVFNFSLIGFQEKLRALKLRLQNVTENDGIRRLIIYYNYAE